MCHVISSFSLSLFLALSTLSVFPHFLLSNPAAVFFVYYARSGLLVVVSVTLEQKYVLCMGAVNTCEGISTVPPIVGELSPRRRALCRFTII